MLQLVRRSVRLVNLPQPSDFPPSSWRWSAGALAVGVLLAQASVLPASVSAADVAVAVEDLPPPTAEESAAARTNFRESSLQLKKSIGELTVLQADYQKKGADHAALEAKFEIAKKEAQEASEALEQAAMTVARSGIPSSQQSAEDGKLMPLYHEAVKVCGAMMATAIQTDDPAKALRLLDQLEKAGAIDGDMLMMGATAAMLLSRLDEASAYLGKLAAVGGSKDKQGQLNELNDRIEEVRGKWKVESALRDAEAIADDLPRVRISTSAGDLVVELFENEAPNTVANFLSLVESGFYDGTPFHRVIPGFMAQGGDPTGRGSGGPGYAIACETGHPSARKHFLGSLSMAHAGKDTAGSQFFLTFRPTDHLDGKHTVFGRVIEGLDVLPKIQRTQTPDGRQVPGVKQATIVKAEVIRKRDHDYVPDTLPDPRK
jgi:hypothetical protein